MEIDGVVIPEDLVKELDGIVEEEASAKLNDIKEYIESGDLDKDISTQQA